MFQGAGATGSDHGNPNSVSDASGQIDIVTVLGSVRVHTCQQNFSRSEVGDSLRPFDGIAIGSYTTAMCIDLCTIVFTASINGDDNALAPESLCRSLNESGVIDCRRVQGYLVGATAQYFLNVVDIAQAASYRKRDIDAVGNASDHLCNDIPAVRRGGNVEKYQFIRAFFRITQTAFNGIARIAEVHKMNALDDAPIFDIKAGNNPLSEHSPVPPQIRSIPRKVPFR